MRRFNTVRRLLKAALAAGVFTLAVWLSMGSAFAAPAAGTLINSQAFGTYSDIGGVTRPLSSNIVQAVVQQITAFTFTATQTKNAAAGSTVYFPHTLTNTGNGVDTFTLTLTDVFSGGFNFTNLNLYADANGDGVPDNLTPISSTGALAAGTVFRFVASAAVPAGAQTGQQDVLTVTARGTSTTTPAPVQTLTDTVTAQATQPGPDLVLQKTHAGNFTVSNNGTYTLLVRNNGTLPTNNVVTVIDNLPAGLVFVPTLSGGTSWTCAAAGQTISCNSPVLVPAQSGTTPGVHPHPLSITVKSNAAVLTTLPVTLINNATVSGGGEPPANAGNNSAADSTVVVQVANLSGRVWRDVDHNRMFTPSIETSLLMANWKVELCPLEVKVCDASTRIGFATTAADGSYAIKDLPAGQYILQFRDPNSNIVNGTPVNGENGTPLPGSELDFAKRSLIITLKPGDNLAQQSLPLDPSGVVYDSITRQPVTGATVTINGPAGFDPTLHLLGGTGNVNQITGPTGFYQYVLLSGFPAGVYTLTVTPPVGYKPGVSALFPPEAGSLTPPAGCLIPVPGICSVELNNGFTAPPLAVVPRYFLSFTLVAGNPDVVNNHIPLDPLGAGAGSGLLVSKTATRQSAEIGDFIDYTVKVQNANAAALPNAVLRDTLPRGFSYVAGSARLNGVVFPDPAPGTVLQFNLGVLPPATTLTVTYRTRIGPGAQQGDGINRAQATSGITQSNVSSVKVRVDGGVFSDKAYVLGKVFLDCNRNGIQDRGELGIPGVRLFIEDGTNVTTDPDGKYSLYGLSPRTHVLKLDTTTLPRDARLIVISNRQSGDAGSRFLDLKNGELGKGDFAVDCSAAVMADVAQRRDTAQKSQMEIERSLKDRLRPEGVQQVTGDVRALPASGVQGVPAGTPGAAVTPSAGTSTAPAATPAAKPGNAAPSSSSSALDNRNSSLPAAPVPAIATVPLDQLITTLDNSLGFVDLKDGDTLPVAQTPVRVKGLAGAAFKLTVNGTEIGSTRVGAKLAIEDKKIQLWEYIGVTLKPGENILTLAQIDGFGNARGEQKIRLIAPADLGAIVIDAPRDVPANGVVSVKVKLTDDKGVPVTVRTALTLEASRGRWQVTDVNPVEPGVQVFIEGGQAEFKLQAPLDPGEDTLRVSSGILKKEFKINYLPDLRQMLAVGLVEGAINFRSLSLRNLISATRRDSFEQEIRRLSYQSNDGKTTAAARAALFLKGKVKGDYLLTIAYDSDKDVRDRLFRDIQPDEFYPIYGDSSTRGFDAQSTQRFYVRVDKGRSFLLYGDFQSSAPGDARKLSDYSRSLTGLKQHYETDRVTVNAFASQDTLRQRVEEIPANGTSGPFQLGNRGGVINSEKIEILTRDRHQPAVILKTESQARFTDYEVEVFTGRILFRGPVSSLDENLNPKSFRITYEVDQGGDKFWVGGVNGKVKITDNVEVGASVVEDRNPQAHYRLSGASVTVKPTEKTVVIAEVARSEGINGTGNAQRIEVRHDDKNIAVRVMAGKSDVNFDNPAAQLSKGRGEYSANVTLKVDSQTTVKAEALRTEDKVTGGSREGVILRAERAFDNGMRVEAGVRHSQETLAPAQATSATPGATPQSVTTARVRVTAPVPNSPQAHIYGEYEQALNDPDKKVAAVGGEYQFAGRGKLYARHEFLSSLSSPFALNTVQRNNTTVFGINTDYAKDRNVFSEYRVREAIDGRTAEAAFGTRSGYMLAEGLKLTMSSERVHTLQGSRANESTANAVALDYTANERLKGSTRLELRQSTQSNSVLASAGAAYKLDSDWTALAKGVYAVTDVKGATPGERLQKRVQAGVAYRDSATDVLNALGRVEYRTEDDNTQPGIVLKRALTVGSMHFSYEPEHGLLINGRAASKWVSENSFGLSSRSSTQLFAARVTMDVTPDWDIGVQMSMLSSRGLRDRQFGVGVEAGYQLAQNTWVSVGYNLFGFKDLDLAGGEPFDKGAFIRLRYKFDENVFKSPKDRPTPVYADQVLPAKGAAATPVKPVVVAQAAPAVNTATDAAPSAAATVVAQAPAAAPAAPVAQALLNEAESLLKAGNAKAAYALLQKQEAELTGDLRFDYLIGVAALDAGLPDMATLAFTRVIAANPNHAGARVDLGRAYIALGQKELAMGELKDALKFNPPEPMRRRIEELLKDTGPSAKLTGYVSAVAGFDSNVNYATAQRDVYVPFFASNITLSDNNVARHAAFGSLSGGARYTHSFNSTVNVFAGADLSGRKLSGASPFDTNAYGAYVGSGLTLGRHDLKAALQFAHTELGGAADRDIAGLAMEWNYNLGSGDQLGMSIRHARVRYAKAELNVFDTNSTRLGVAMAGAWGARVNWLATLFAGAESDLKGNPYGAQTAFGLSLAGGYRLTNDLTLTGGVAAQHSFWDGFNVAFQTEREDTRYDFSLGLNYRLADGWTLAPRVARGINHSNLSIFSYRRNEYSLMLRRDWI